MPLCRVFAGYSFVFVSLNRFERKKNIRLALEALAYLRSLVAGRGDKDDASVVLEVGIHSPPLQ